MAVPIFQQYMQALASGNDVNTITPELLASVRTANKPIVTLPQGYAPDFSDRAGAIGGLARLFTDPSNRNVIPNFSGSGRTSENMAGVALGDADLTMPVSSGGPSYIDKALASMRGSIPNINVPNINMPDMSLPANAYDLGQAVAAAPADIANRLMSPFNAASIALGNAGNAILDSDLVGGLTGREEGTTYTGNKALAAADLIEKAKVTNPSDPTNAAKTISGVQGTVPKGDTTAIKGTADDDTNWFDAVNERVDLMAMGAAMLAGSGSGMGTAANLGRGLQAGIAARTGQAKAAEDKQYKDAALLLDSMRARAAMQAAGGTDNIYKNYGAKIDDLGADLVGLGVPQDEAKAVASTIFSSTNGNVMNMDPNARNTFLEQIIDQSTGIFDIGKKDVKLGDIRPAIVDITTGNI